jgi:hypothetical protein
MIKVCNQNHSNQENKRKGNQKWTIQRNWQHRAHKTKKNKTQYVLDKVALFPVSDMYFIVLVTIYN